MKSKSLRAKLLLTLCTILALCSLSSPGTYQPGAAASVAAVPAAPAVQTADDLAMLGKPVRASIGGHMLTIFLTDFDVSNGTYWGLGVRNRTMDSSERAPIFSPVKGLRPYPYKQMPEYAFQFVQPGDLAGEQALLEIARANSKKRNK